MDFSFIHQEYRQDYDEQGILPNGQHAVLICFLMKGIALSAIEMSRILTSGFNSSSVRCLPPSAVFTVVPGSLSLYGCHHHPGLVSKSYRCEMIGSDSYALTIKNPLIALDLGEGGSSFKNTPSFTISDPKNQTNPLQCCTNHSSCVPAPFDANPTTAFSCLSITIPPNPAEAPLNDTKNLSP